MTKAFVAAGPQFLYRLRDHAGRLLYVGVTKNVAGRLTQHRQDNRLWWPAVATQEVEEFPDRATAELAEKAAIDAERPALNVLHAAERTAWRKRGLSMLTIGIEAANWTRGLRIAHARGESLNDVVRAAVAAYVAEHEGVLDAKPVTPPPA